MELVIDLGNTTCRVYFFDGYRIRAMGTIPSGGTSFEKYMKAWCRWARQWGATTSTVVSVVPVLEDFVKSLIEAENLGLFWIKQGREKGVPSEIPRDMGPDRIANLAGAIAFFDQPTIVVDLGTALTVDAVDRRGNYLGGVIFPGPDTVAASLKAHTACLPQLGWLGLSQPKSAPSGTKSGLEAGLVWGYQDLVSGFSERLEGEMGDGQPPRTIMTGGGARSMVELPRGIQFYEPYLTAKGAAHISLANREAP